MPTITAERLTDADTRAAATDKVANMAIARLRRYEMKLKEELQACGDVYSDLIAYANTGKPSDIPGHLARAQAIKTVLAEIPRAIAAFADEHNAAVRLRNEAASSARATAARKAYKIGLKEFEAHYSELAHSRDRSALRRAGKELARLAREAGEISDLRRRFKKVAWRGRYRISELAQI